MQIRVTRKGLMMTFGIIAALAAVTGAVLRPGDEAAGSGQDQSKIDPDTVVSHVVENTPGFWTPEKMEEGEPMPLLSSDRLPPDATGPAADGTPPASSRTSIGKPRPPHGTRGKPAKRPRYLR